MANSPFIFGANGATSLVPGGVNLPGSTSGTLQLQPAASTTSYTVTMPGSQGGVSNTLSNDGSGNLSWVAGLPAVGSDGQLLKSMNSTYIQSSYYTPYINYIGNAFAETNTNGWATYSNTAANIPSNGTGGTATGLTFSRTTSSPLRDTGTFSIVQANSTSLQGKGVSYPFTIDSQDQAKALSIQLDYNASSTFVAGNGVTPPLNDGTTTTNAGNSDIEVFMYDVTNAVLLPVSPETFTANGSNNFTFKGIFQTSSNSTSYRLILHCATTSANATGYTFKFTNVFVGPQYIVQGSPATDLVPYTPIFTNFGTVTAVSFWSRRIGDCLEVRGLFTSGSGNASPGQITLGFNGTSGNVTVDSTKVTSNMIVGVGGISVNNAAEYVVLAVGGVNYLQFGIQSGTAAALTVQNGNVYGNGTTLGFIGLFPITGWSSNTLMSNDANTRVLAATYYVSSNFSASNTTPVNFDTKVTDTHGAVTPSPTAWKFTAPVSGYYIIGSGGLQVTATSGVIWSVYKNGSIYRQLCDPANGTYAIPTNAIVPMIAGDFIDIRPQTSFTVLGNATFSNSSATSIDIYQLQGPAQLSVVDSVNARYFASATSVSGSLATISWTTKDYDSHGGMSSGTYTVPVSGKYQVNSAILVSGTVALNSTLIMEIQKNGTVLSRYTEYAGGVETNMKGLITDQINCVAGDTLRIQVSTSISGPSIVSSNFDNYISLFRTGN